MASIVATSFTPAQGKITPVRKPVDLWPQKWVPLTCDMAATRPRRRAPSKDQWIKFRVTANQKLVLEQAAEREELTLSAWLLSVGIARAKVTVEEPVLAKPTKKARAR